MKSFSTGNPSPQTLPFHPSLLVEDESIVGVNAAKRYFAKAYEQQTLGNLAEAIHGYRDAVAACPDMFEAYFNLALCYEKRHDYQRAIQSFEKAARIQYTFKPIYRHLAHLYALLGNHEMSKLYDIIHRKY